MSKILSTLLIYCLAITSVIAGLPPTSSKVSGESVYSTTFKTDFGTFKGTRSGTTLTLNSIGAGVGDSLVLGGTKAASAIVDIQSTTQGVLPPRMTTAQMNAIPSPANGLTIYNTDFNSLATYNGTTWTYGFGNIVGDGFLSAHISGTTITSVNKPGWIASLTNPSTGQYNIVPATGTFTVLPVCTLTQFNSSGGVITTTQYMDTASTTSNLIFKTIVNAAATATELLINCSKQGADYTAASSSAFATTNANISSLYTASPPSGSINNSINIITYGTKVIDTNNAYSSGSYTVPSGAGGNYDIQAQYSQLGGGSANSYSAIYVYINGVNKYQFNKRWDGVSNDMIVPIVVQSVPLAAGDVVTFRSQTNTSSPSYESNATTNFFSIVKTNSGIIVGSFAGTPNVPGYQGKVDSFSVNFGGATISTNCSSTPCTLYNQIGTSVTSNTRAATGAYTANFSKTYSILNCQIQGYSTTSSNGSSAGESSCTNCNSLNYLMRRNDSAANIDSYGSLMCQGTY